ncbi:HPr family phosphocarrier protein [Butyrivibrio sp. MC2013]|uniref:HPr family phosphocarrier protein n=1 Tax=Butyrivibrio sp. MC2013 TaxID=1280686 RepID=UPI0004076A4D|nr:HPr family phosphocarrier protein [Butyrivibrio sp. MC2013]
MIAQKTERIIRLEPSEVRNFVREAEKCQFDIDVSYGSIIVDGKSILGILGLDMRKNLTVSYYGESREFDEYLDRLEA